MKLKMALGLELIVMQYFALGKASSASHLDLRYTDVIEQSNEYTCDAAAVATLLTYFYDIPVSERDVLNLVYESMRVRGEKPEQEHGLTAYDLKEALEYKGVETKGFLVKPADLQDYFSRGGLPVIIHLTKPEKHFEVAVVMIGDKIVIADPSWGRSVTPLTLLVEQRGYDRVVLLPIPPAELAHLAAVRQRKTLEWAALRLCAAAGVPTMRSSLVLIFVLCLSSFAFSQTPFQPLQRPTETSGQYTWQLDLGYTPTGESDFGVDNFGQLYSYTRFSQDWRLGYPEHLSWAADGRWFFRLPTYAQ